MEKTVLDEKERSTQIKWDMEELRKQCMELESMLNSLKVCVSLSFFLSKFRLHSTIEGFLCIWLIGRESTY